MDPRSEAAVGVGAMGDVPLVETAVFWGGPILVVSLALLVWWLARRVFVRMAERLSARSHNRWDDALVAAGVPGRLAWLAPIAVLQLGLEHVVPNVAIQDGIGRMLGASMAMVVAATVSAVLGAAARIATSAHDRRATALRSLVQLAQIGVTLAGGIVGLAMLLDQPPWALLSGLGALTAVMLLIFKDTILGMVASMQIAAYDTVRVGDWIEMPRFEADGDVIEISLHTVKVRNWDKTITTIPTHALIEHSFKNWRGMQESGGRRIKRHLLLDQHSVHFLSEEELATMQRIELLRPYLGQKLTDIEQDTTQRSGDLSLPTNVRRLTNLGTFRAYCEAYLRAHARLRQDMTFLIRQLQPGATGIPLEIYLFTATTVWAEYEAIQADIFDHLLAVLPLFGLRVYQYPAAAAG